MKVAHVLHVKSLLDLASFEANLLPIATGARFWSQSPNHVCTKDEAAILLAFLIQFGLCTEKENTARIAAARRDNDVDGVARFGRIKENLSDCAAFGEKFKSFSRRDGTELDSTLRQGISQAEAVFKAELGYKYSRIGPYSVLPSFYC